MNRETVMEVLKEIIADVLGDTGIVIKESTKLDSIEGWDSHIHLSFMESVQDEFGIRFSIDEILNVSSVREIISSVIEKHNIDTD